MWVLYLVGAWLLIVSAVLLILSRHGVTARDYAEWERDR